MRTTQQFDWHLKKRVKHIWSNTSAGWYIKLFGDNSTVTKYWVHTLIMSDLTDNKFYPSGERVWLCTCMNNVGKRAFHRLTEDADFGKKSSFQMKLINCVIFFFSKMSNKRPLQAMAIVIGPCWTNFYSQTLKRRILATFSFNRTALRAAQAKLHLMFCVLFLTIALSVADLISFSHLGAAIWHR